LRGQTARQSAWCPVTEYGKFRNVENAEPCDFDSAFFRAVGVSLQKAFQYKNPWGFTDIDVMTERNGRMLLIERKEPPIAIYQKGLTAQKKAMEGMTRRHEGSLGIVVWADRGFDHIEGFRVCYGGEWTPLEKEDTQQRLLNVIEQWGLLVTEMGPLESWNPKWYPR